MEVINHSQSPQKKKRTFIASMNKYNPYRICTITESVYDRILLNRELATEIKVESPRDPKVIYLPPVKIEETSKKIIKKPTKRRSHWSPSSLESTPKDTKIESFQLLSKSLDFNYAPYEKPQTGINQNRKLDPRCDKKATTWKIRKNSGDYYNERHRTMSALQDRDNLKIPSKFRESRSPWVFQTSRFFQV